MSSTSRNKQLLIVREDRLCDSTDHGSRSTYKVENERSNDRKDKANFRLCNRNLEKRKKIIINV